MNEKGIVEFDAIENQMGLLHYWDLGDGYKSGPGPYPVTYENYDTTGYYTVTHIMRDTFSNCSDTASERIYVYVLRDSCGAPVFMFYTADSLNPQVIHFSCWPDSGVYSYHWDFGDGVMSTDQSPIHKYTNVLGSSYNIKLTVNRPRNGDSCLSYAINGIYVTGSDRCSTDFSYTPDASRPYEIRFSALDPGGRDSLNWYIVQPPDSMYFRSMYGQNPIYTFRDTGVYIVGLIAIDSLGCSSYKSQTIHIDQVPESNRSYISTYPNPVSGIANADLKLTFNETIHIRVFNSMGVLQLTKTVSGFAGMNHIGLPTDGWPRGIYYIWVQYGDETRHSKIQKL